MKTDERVLLASDAAHLGPILLQAPSQPIIPYCTLAPDWVAPLPPSPHPRLLRHRPLDKRLNFFGPCGEDVVAEEPREWEGGGEVRDGGAEVDTVALG